MKGSRLSFVLVLLVLAAGCKDLGEPSTDDVASCKGTIIQKSAETFLIEADVLLQKKATTLYPLNLPGVFKRDSLRVRFSGKIEVAPNEQYICDPIRLSRIELIER